MRHIKRINYRQKLAFRQANYAVIILMILGVFITGMQLHFDWLAEKQRIDRTVHQILQVFNRPAARAILEIDIQLAETIIDGIVAYPPVSGASIKDAYGHTLIEKLKSNNESKHDLAKILFPDLHQQPIPIQYQKGETAVGHIIIQIDNQFISEQLVKRSTNTVISGFFRILLLAIILIIFFYYWLTRPLIDVINSVASIDYDYPDKNLLKPVKFHKKDELGLLSVTINQLLKGFGRSLSQHKETEQQLARHRDQLEVTIAERTSDLKVATQLAEQANQDKSRFLAAASHDLRQPLQAVTLFSGALHQYLDNPKAIEVHQKLEESLAATQALFNALMDISKLDAGTFKAEMAHFPLQDIFNRLAMRFGQQAMQKTLRLYIRPTTLSVYSDPTMLERLLSNFISNAIKYTPSGGVVAGCRCHGKDIRIDVYDTGLGISEDDQKVMFDEFVQFNNPERDRNKGLGLGLAIICKLSQILNHPITWRSILGQGSRFSVTLPISHLTDQITPLNQPEENQHTINEGVILIIDNEQEILDSMALLLSQWGFKVMAALDLNGAMSCIENQPPHLIISDYRLEKSITGIDVIQQIQTTLEKPAIAALMSGDANIIQDPENHYPVIHKPILPSQLRALINHLLRKQNKPRNETMVIKSQAKAKHKE